MGTAEEDDGVLLKRDEKKNEDEDEEAWRQYEATHVHSVYSSIASHFSLTRRKPWPGVARFLERLPSGAVGLDVGCGNGKYIGVNKGVWMVGSDACKELLLCARDCLGRSSCTCKSARNGYDGAGERERNGGGEACIQADALALPFRRGAADFAICVAVLHHLSTRERRIQGINAVLQCLRPGAPALLCVWALEQQDSRRGWREGGEQDVLVPWIVKGSRKRGGKGPAGTTSDDTTYRRFYHLYASGELEEDVRSACGKIVESGYERDNWWVVCQRE